jgi:hypothetical protein
LSVEIQRYVLFWMPVGHCQQPATITTLFRVGVNTLALPARLAFGEAAKLSSSVRLQALAPGLIRQ